MKDWGQWPEQHCRKIVHELENRKIDPEIIREIASFEPKYFGLEPEIRMDKMLNAFDELSEVVLSLSPAEYQRMQVME